MKTIYKYALEITDLQTLHIPSGYKILTVQVQDRQLVLWAEVDTKAMPVPVGIEIYGTGNPIHEVDQGGRRYIATVQSGGFVWHVYEVILG